MRYFKIILMGLLCIFWLNSCFKDYDVDIDDTVALGESLVYLNGEESNLTTPFISYSTIHNIINYAFGNVEDFLPNEGRSVGFSFASLERKNFFLCKNRDDCEGGVETSFSHIVGSDLRGFTYQLVNKEEGYFEVTQLDTIQRTVQGRFKVQFKRTTKNGNGDIIKDLPKRLTFEGVFHEEYEVR